MKLFVDFFPLALFFAAYKYYGDIVPATPVLMGATAVQMAIYWFKDREIPKMQLFTAIMVIGAGGLTVVLDNDAFLRHKPTILYIIMASFAILSNFVGEKPLMQRAMGDTLPLPDNIWRNVTWAFAIFFIASAAANHVVASYFSKDFWVNFKLFGMLGATFVFVIGLGVYLQPHMAELEEANEDGTTPDKPL